MKEHCRRSLAKTISWRTLATTTTIMIVYVFTGRLTLSLGIGFTELIIKMIVYYFHERLWIKISWGRMKHSLEDLKLTRDLTPNDKELICDKLEELGYL